MLCTVSRNIATNFIRSDVVLAVCNGFSIEWCRTEPRCAVSCRLFIMVFLLKCYIFFTNLWLLLIKSLLCEWGRVFTCSAPGGIAMKLVFTIGTVRCTIASPCSGYATPDVSTLERLRGTGLGVLTLLVRPVRTVLPPITHEEPADADACRATLYQTQSLYINDTAVYVKRFKIKECII